MPATHTPIVASFHDAGWSPSLQNSRALYSLLGQAPGDAYDAAAFTVAAGGPDQFVVGLSALVPACAPYDSVYPSLALLGPASDPRFPPPDAATAAALPFAVPPGAGVILRAQPRAPRAVFADNPAQAYYLPAPLTRDCLLSPEAFAACGNGTAAETSVVSQLPGREAPLAPGRYVVAWWDPDRLPGGQGAPSKASLEVIVALGTGEEPTPRERDIQVAVMTGRVRPWFDPCAAGAGAAGAARAGAGVPAPEIALLLVPGAE